jgi:hypothetical protein
VDSSIVSFFCCMIQAVQLPSPTGIRHVCSETLHLKTFYYVC